MPGEERRALGRRNRAAVEQRFGTQTEAAAYGALYAGLGAITRTTG